VHRVYSSFRPWRVGHAVGVVFVVSWLVALDISSVLSGWDRPVRLYAAAADTGLTEAVIPV
jgi:hypothetical protein